MKSINTLLRRVGTEIKYGAYPEPGDYVWFPSDNLEPFYNYYHIHEVDDVYITYSHAFKDKIDYKERRCMRVNTSFGGAVVIDKPKNAVI